MMSLLTDRRHEHERSLLTHRQKYSRRRMNPKCIQKRPVHTSARVRVRKTIGLMSGHLLLRHLGRVCCYISGSRVIAAESPTMGRCEDVFHHLLEFLFDDTRLLGRKISLFRFILAGVPYPRL